MRILAFLFAVILIGTAQAQPVRTDHLQSQLISQHQGAIPGGVLMLGLLLEHDPGWHTYWRNPGDSGLPTRVTLTVNGESLPSELLWPLPERFPLDAQLVNFGYKGRVVLPLVAQLPADLTGDSLLIEAQASWLVCEEACIPGSVRYQLTLPVTATAQTDPRWQQDFDQAARRQPRQAAEGAQYRLERQQVVLSIPRAAFPGSPADWVFFPETAEVVRNSREPNWQRRGRHWVAWLDRNEFFTQAPPQFHFMMVRDDDGIRLTATLDTQ